MRDRTRIIKAQPCDACTFDGRLDVCGVTEEHHLNLDDHAGQKRIGNDDTVPLGTWHHRGVPKRGWTVSRMTDVYGPSLAHQPKEFRRVYGKGDTMLARVNRKLGLS